MDTKSVENEKGKLQKSYFDVLGLCCSSEVPLIEKILKIEGIFEVSVIVPSRTVIVLHDITLISQQQIVKALNQARLEANVRVKGKANYKAKWPSPFVIMSGLLLALSFLKYVYHPLQWLAVGAVAVGIWPILVRGFIALRTFTLDINILMIIAVICTIVMRDYTEAGTIVFLFTIAEWLESRASQKATAVMSSLLSMAPQKATIAETGEVVNVEDVKLNTVVAVKTGEMVPVDGVVVEGTCEVDEKTLTGESYPVPKQKDSQVWAGTVNVNGYVSVKTTALAEDSAVAKMARLVEDAQNSRSNVQRLIDKCAKYYTPAVILISLGVAVVPAILKVHNLRHWFYLALVVLVSACPCGLILSTPVATFCALSRAATTGLLIKGGDYLETLAKIKTIAFDKTGTITRGEFTLMNFQTLSDNVSLRALLYWVSSIESKSSHPIASVLVDYGRSQSIEPKPQNVEEFQNFPGEGVFGKIDGRDLYIGNKKLAQRAKCNLATNFGGDKKEGATSGYIYCGGVLIGTFHLSDNCRSGAVDAIRELKAMGIRTALLTGDNQSAAMRAQEQLGNALDIVYAELLPENKASIITDLKKNGPTAMVGDGVNDAPALATADVGISMGVSGSALATDTGHVILMSNDIRKIPTAIKLARKTRRKVIENIFISILTKACVLTSAIAWHPLVWLAVLADVLTCLIVIFNSMLLLREGHKGHEHDRKWFRLFSCHSHKSKCHSSMNQQCCSKNAPTKTCETVECASRCALEKGCPKPNKNDHAISESSKCLFHDCSSSWELGNEHASDSHAPHHQSTCCEDDHCLEALESQTSCGAGDGPEDEICCESDKHEIISECHHEHSKEHHIHESEKPNALSNCQHEHPKESHIHESEKPKTLSKCQHEHSNEIHIHEPEKPKSLSECQHEHPKEFHVYDNNDQKNHDYGVSQQKKATVCKDHRTRPREIHVGHHHHIVRHGACHSHAVASHGCSNLRKREVGACCKSYRKNCCTSQGNFASGFRGLTEIVTE